jgi:hypothetical protein
VVGAPDPVDAAVDRAPDVIRVTDALEQQAGQSTGLGLIWYENPWAGVDSR